MIDYARMKEATKWMWALADYTEVATRLQPHAVALADACPIRPGMAVLDVAAGNGNFAVEAARRGAVVTATDLTPRMLELGRARTRAEGVAVEWREADAEELPFEANGFDLVASVFGAMFAPRPERVAAELFRVVKPGGLVAMANYGPDGFLAGYTQVFAKYSPPQSADLPSPFAWGDLAQVRSRFKDLASSIDIEPRTVRFEFASPADGLEFWQRTNPPTIALKAMLPPEKYQEFLDDGTRVMRELNQARDGRLVLDSAYVLVLARKRTD
jgi:ubiquinone/menaquinone biosynthesis C-methylase UbiE